MSTKIKWVAVAQDGNGKQHIFTRILNEKIINSYDEVENFRKDIENRGLCVNCMYRQKDIVERSII